MYINIRFLLYVNLFFTQKLGKLMDLKKKAQKNAAQNQSGVLIDENV